MYDNMLQIWKSYIFKKVNEYQSMAQYVKSKIVFFLYKNLGCCGFIKMLGNLNKCYITNPY